MSRPLTIVLLGTLITLFQGLRTNFPFLYPDSAAYLASGIDQNVPYDRPIFYGLFLRHTHMLDNLYFPMIAQCLIISYVLYLLFYYFSSAKQKDLHYLLTMCVLACFTGYSFFACFLMPDIFSSVLVVSIGILLFAKVSKLHFYILSGLAIFATLVHNAHGLILLIILGVIGFLWMVNYRDSRQAYSGYFKKIFSIYGIALVLAIFTNFAYTKQLFVSRSGSVFFLSRMNEMGILKSYLQEKCNDQNGLCAYKDSLVADFIWDSNSPFNKLGGFKQSHIFAPIALDIVKSPKYLFKIAVASTYSTLCQFGSFDIEPQQVWKLPYIKEQFKAHQFNLDISFQNRGNRLDFTDLNEHQWILVLFSIVLLFSLASRKITIAGDLRWIYLLFAFLMLNAFVSATFSTVLARYQGRLIYLLVLLVLLYLPKYKEIYAVMTKDPQG